MPESDVRPSASECAVSEKSAVSEESVLGCWSIMVFLPLLDCWSKLCPNTKSQVQPRLSAVHRPVSRGGRGRLVLLGA